MMKSKKLAVLAALLSLLVLASLLVVPAFADGSDDTTTVATETTTGADETTTAATETTTAADKGLTTSQIRGIVNLGVGALILIVLAVLAIKFRAKIPGWFAALKSECGKITWCPSDKLKKNTLVVVIIIVAITATIYVLDFTFGTGIVKLGELVTKLAK